MKTRTFFLVGLGLALFAGIASAQPKQKTQELREMTVSVLKQVSKVPPSQDSTVLIVKSTIANLDVASEMAPSENVKKISDGVWHLFLPADTQTIYFRAAGFKLVERKYTTFARNRVYEVEVKPKKGRKTLWWVLGGAAVGGGAYVAFSGGGKTTTPPDEKLPDPPGGPTGN